MAAILRLVLSVVVWFAGLTATRAVLEPVVRQGGETFPQLAWPALAVALLGAAGAYGILATGWGRWMDGRSAWLRIPFAVVWAGLAALVFLAAVRGIVRVDPATGAAPTAPALLLALLGSQLAWAAGLLLALAGATLGARPPERRRRLGGGPPRFG